MPAFTLRLAAPTHPTQGEARGSFYWLSDSRSSFQTGLDPNLSQIGAVPALNVDLARIAVGVFAADHSVWRAGGGSNWNSREIGLTVPVSDVAKWEQVGDDLNWLVGFLTGDRWTIEFVEHPSEDNKRSTAENSPSRIVLLSGGADSAVGALLSRSQLDNEESHVLVSHFSANTLPPIQRRIVETSANLLPGPEQTHLQFHLSRRSERIDGTEFPTENSSRSRSLLFLALGLAVAAVYDVELWIPENGFASLNPPLGPERLGSVSTRTTHPAFLAGLQDILGRVGAHHDLVNPFAAATKGEMYSRAAELVGETGASAYLSATHSCAHTGQRAFGVSPTESCGVCFGCVIRRAAFSASGLADATAYIDAGPNGKLADWLASKSVVPAVRNFVRRGVRERDLTGLSLPLSYPLADARGLCERGIAELVGLGL